MKAIAIVLAILLAVPVANMALGSRTEGDMHASDAAALRFSQLDLATGDPFATLQAVDDSMRASTATVPEYFRDEVGLPRECRDVRTDGESVVGCVVDGGASEAMAVIDEHMRGEGWTPVPLGETEGATYVKEGGACRWTLVTCTQVGDATSVVYRCIAR